MNDLIGTRTYWLAWQKAPRSANLANALSIPFVHYYENGGLLKRHLFSSFWTVKFLIRERPLKILIHFSYLLLLILIVYRQIFDSRLIIIADCHNQALQREISGILGRLFSAFKNFILSRANLVIVTNKYLLPIVRRYNENTFVLPDKIPDTDSIMRRSISAEYCVCISSFSSDEPIDLLMNSVARMGSTMKFYFTGNAPREIRDIAGKFKNIQFTGFIDYKSYLELLAGAKCLVVLSSEDNILQCGAYEGLSVGVPLVLSDNPAARAYFGDAAVYTQIDGDSIVSAIKKALNENESMKAASKKIKSQREEEFAQLIDDLKEKVDSLT